MVAANYSKDSMYHYYQFYPDGQLQVKGFYADSISKIKVEITSDDLGAIYTVQYNLPFRNHTWYYYSPTGALEQTVTYQLVRENLPEVERYFKFTYSFHKSNYRH